MRNGAHTSMNTGRDTVLDTTCFQNADGCAMQQKYVSSDIHAKMGTTFFDIRSSSISAPHFSAILCNTALCNTALYMHYIKV